MIDQTTHERRIVGLAMLSPDVIDRAELELSSHQWHDAALGDLWRMLCAMRREGIPIADIAEVVAGAKREGIYEALGGAGGLARLVSQEAGLKHDEEYHLRQLSELSERSRLRRLASSLAAMANDESQSSESVIDWIHSELASNSRSVRVQTKTIAQAARKAIAPKSMGSGVRVGLSTLDDLNSGMHPGEMHVLAARPSIGKTALAVQMGMHVAWNGGRVLMISLEMEDTEIARRELSRDTGIEFNVLREGVNESQAQDLLRSIDALDKLPFIIADYRQLNIDRISQLVRAEASRHRLSLVIIDYIGLIDYDHKKPKWEAVTEFSNRLKSLAKSEKLPILVLCQLNREAEAGRPTLGMLRESGAIEQDADCVMLLHGERGTSERLLIVEKNRHGETGDIPMVFESFQFQEVDTSAIAFT